MNTKGIAWEKLRPKVYVKHLARDKKRDFQIDIIKLEPNTAYEEHQHTDIEWIFVLKGSFKDETGTYKMGHFKLNPKNSKHTVTTGKDGCEILTCWCGKLKTNIQ